MRNIYCLLSLLFIFPLKIHSAIDPEEPLAKLWRPVRRSIATLKSSFNEIKNLAYQIRPQDLSLFIDIRNNQIEVRYRNKRGNNVEFFAAIGKFNPIFVKANSSSTNCAPTSAPARNKRQSQILKRRNINSLLLCGDGIFNVDSNRGCSLGFYASDKSDENLNFIVTAGHCFDWTIENNPQLFYSRPWNENTGKRIGLMPKNPSNIYDYGLINITDNKGIITPSIRNTDHQYSELIIEGGRVLSSIGVHICKSGRTSHVNCAYVIGFGGIHVDTRSNILEDFIVADNSGIFDCKGDSGGPTYSYLEDLQKVTLNGIISGSIDTLSHIVPLDIILKEAGLDLIKVNSLIVNR
ncbi:protease [Gigaspora margarita]|uniref:Protease n=1 Tax=Gigaspora margarita TaxID=4874 RepID=A0A8H4ANP0_GIGMA|nr:protease [Gigaspora margarita]